MVEIFYPKVKFSLKLDVEFYKRCQTELAGYYPNINSGYFCCRIPKVDKIFLLHRFLLNVEKGFEVDHINGDKADNRKQNLRICSISQNRMNAAKRKNTTSKYKGVSFHKQRNKWSAKIQIDKVVKALGLYKTEEEAARAYNYEAKLLHGKFAKLNDIKYYYMKSFIFIFFASTLSCLSAVEFDLVKGTDMTATNYRPASLYNQLVDNATIGATNKGGIIRQATTPNTGDNPRYTNFIYISNSVVATPTLMLWNGSGWIPGIVGANTVGSTAIQDGAITSGKIAGSAVFGTNIAGNTIQSTNLADNSISGDKIANNGIWQGKFQPLAIRGIDITNRTIWNTNLVLSSITSNEMAILSIPTPMLTDGAVTTAKIASTNVTRDSIKDYAIGSLQITNFALNTNHFSTNLPLPIAWGAVTNSSGSGTATILRGINVSVARVAAGRFTVTFITPPADLNYGVIATVIDPGANTFAVVSNKTSTAFEIRTMNASASIADNNQIMFQVLY